MRTSGFRQVSENKNSPGIIFDEANDVHFPFSSAMHNENRRGATREVFLFLRQFVLTEKSISSQGVVWLTV